MKLILLALAASLFTLVMMVQARSEATGTAVTSVHVQPAAGISVNDRTPTRKDMAVWNARRKMHAVRQED